MPPDTVREFDGGIAAVSARKTGRQPVSPQGRMQATRKRLKLLSPTDRKALARRRAELNEGQYFSEFSRGLHVVKPYAIPHDSAALPDHRLRSGHAGSALIAQKVRTGNSVVYRELYRPGLIISDAAAQMLACETAGEHIDCRLAPPDLWN